MSLLFTPDGGVVNTERQQQHWPLWFMKFLHTFVIAVFDAHLQLAITCQRCKEELHGQNADADNFWKMECSCRTYIGRNPQPTAKRVGRPN